MKTLLQINTTLNCGSTGRIAEQIASLASSKGWDTYIAHGGRFVADSKHKTIQVSSKFDNYLHALYGELCGRHGLASKKATRDFVKCIEGIRPDIIHLHNIHGYYLNYQFLFEYLAESKTPVVWTLHDCWAFTGHCTHFDKIGCDKWKSECGNCPLLMAQYKSRIIDRSKKNFLLKKSLYEQLSNVTIVPVSTWLGDFVKQSILNKFPLKVIHNGVDLNIFKPLSNDIRRKYSIPEDKLIVLGVFGSGSGPEKGRSEFIELSNNEEFQIILVGLNEKDAKLLPNNIIKIQKTNSQSELAKYYSVADVMLNPTYNDTFPTTNLEALACGTPVVTYKTGGSPEAIDDNTGFVVEKGDINGLIDAIMKIKNIGKHTYAKLCRDRAVSLFNKDERFMDYIELYDGLI